MSEIIGPDTDDSESPILDYIRVKRDEKSYALWHHSDSDETLAGPELSEANDTDEWSLKWYCPKCGTVEPPDSERKTAGMSTIHVPCASDDELAAAEEQEERVEKNIQNAEAFEKGGYDG